ncbi:AfsR/SARP family transcriptional regulator [Occultella glacieicola]|nr:BTAD domain-containing putative transcriptional regulator [Occultella glacieicola]
MRFGVLGPLQVLDGETEVTPSGRLQRTLLAHLLAHVNRPVTAGVLADAAWPGLREGGPGRLQVHLHRLRKLLDTADRLTHGPDGYVLHAETDEFDATLFESLRNQALAPGLDHTRMIPLAHAAQALWRGEAYEGLDGDAVRAEAWRLTELDLELLEVRYTVELGHHNHAAVLSDLAALAAGHPLRERLQGLLITGLYRAGRQADALEHYRRTHRALAEELGVEPGPELRGVHALVLSGEAAVAPSSAPPRPNQLRPAVTGFVGRRAELSALHHALGSGARTALIAGPAGAGKTSLALQWAHEHREVYPDGQLYADLGGFSARPPLTAGAVITSWLLALGVSNELIPRDLDGRSALLRSLTVERRLLLVADNAGEPDQVRPLLPGDGTSVLLVTSRHALPGLVGRDGVPRVDLGGLTEADAVSLLATHTQDRELLPALAGRCGYLPLALRLLVEQIGTGTQPMAQLLAELDDHRTRLDLLDAAGDPDAGIRSVLSWSYESLTQPDRRLLQHLGVHAGADLDAADLAALADVDGATARRGLETLRRVHLVEPADGRYTQHDLLAAYTRELAEHELSHDARRESLSRLIRHLTRTGFLACDTWAPTRAPHRAAVTDGYESPFTTPALAASWAVRQRSNVVALARAARTLGVPGLVDLAQAVAPLLHPQGYLHEAVELLTQTVESSAEDPDRIPIMEVSLGALLDDVGRVDDAVRRTENALIALRSEGSPDRQAVAVCNLGSYESELGHCSRAEDLYREALALFDESGHTRHRPHVLGQLGATVMGLGRIADGHALMMEATAMARTERQDDELATMLDQLAEYAVEWLDLASARRYADELHTLVCDRQLRRTEPAALCWQSILAAEDGDLDAAERYVERGLSLAREIQLTGSVPRMINVRGMVDARRGDHGTALARHQEALALAARARTLPEHAHGHRHLGRTYEALGDPRAAARHYARAVQQYAAYERVGRYPDLAAARLAALTAAAVGGPTPERVPARSAGRTSTS